MRETGISYEHLWLTVVRAVSDAEKTEGKPLPGHPPQGGKSRRGKSKQEEQTTCLSIHPSFFWKEQEEAKRAGGSLRTRRETSLMQLGQHHAVGITFPQTEGWMHSPLPLPPWKDQGKAFHVPLPQASASDEHQKIWAGSRFLFSSLSPVELNRLEDTREEEGSGHLKAPIQLPR